MGLKLQSVSGGSVELNSPITTNNYVVTMPAQSGTVMMAENYQPSFKNRIINGAMMIDQRNAGASVTPTDGTYTLDRWKIGLSQASKLTVQQIGAYPVGAGFTQSLRVTSSSAYPVGTNDYFFFGQTIEGFNVADLEWGVATAKAVTISFWVYSSLSGTFGGGIRNSAGNRSYPFTYTISSANTWEQKTITIPGDTTGTWVKDNGTGLNLNFGLGVGSTFSGTAGAWAAGNYVSATGATSVVGTNGATFYITGVQLEKGSTATSFDYRPYGTELQLCQRYYWYCNYEQRGFTNEAGRGVLPATGINFRTTPSISSNATTVIENGTTVIASPTGWTSITPSGAAWTSTNNGAYPNRGVVFQTLRYSAEL